MFIFGLNEPAFAQKPFYYGRGGQKVFLDVSPDKLIIKLKDTSSHSDVANLLTTIAPVTTISSLRAAPNFFIAQLNPETSLEDVERYVEELDARPEVAVVSPVYLNDGVESIPFDQFVVRFEPSVTPDQIERLNRRHHVEVVRISAANPHRYTFRITAASGRSALEMSQLYFESLPAVYALPDFVLPIQLHGNPGDPYFAYQYYYNQSNDIDLDAPEAWDVTKGSSSVIVAVIDEGVASHEDLPASRLVPGFDVFNLTGGAPGGNEAHGMAAAGLIAASHNTKGIAGMAPNVKIMPVRIFDVVGRGVSSDSTVLAIEFAWMNGAHVLSNSWGYSTCNNDFSPPLRDAIEEAMSQGRSGLGSVVVFSAGNSAGRSTGNYGCVTFPANIPGVLTVGAVDRSGNVQNYSPRDTELDVVAPSGGLGAGSTSICNGQTHNRLDQGGDVWSLDIGGTPGYNPGNYGVCPPTNYTEYVWQPPTGEPTPTNNYTANFGGTSAACPQVSGIAALMLSSSVAALTDDDVVSTIRATADDMGAIGFDQDFG
ncbi:S8 family serine peptidase [Rhodocaloribacter sp.]